MSGDILTPRQEKFIAKYLETGNATQAYLEAGYSKKGAESGAARLLGNVKVTHRINEFRSLIAKTTTVTVKDIIDDLVAVKTRCMQGEPVLDRDGNPTGEWRFDSRGAIQALGLIGKHLGMWKEAKPGEETTPVGWFTPIEYNPNELIDMILESREESENGPQIESAAKIYVQPTSANRTAMGEDDSKLPNITGLQKPPKPDAAK